MVTAQTQAPDFEQKWLRALENHLSKWMGDQRGSLKTLYLGGGTPSLISPKGIASVRELIEKYYDWNVEEWTIECNPESLSREKLLALHSIGVNRLSVGVQTFIPEQLRRLERLATFEHIEKILGDVQNIFKNFSIDLMIGIADQTSDSLEQDLEKIRKLRPPHLSVYILTLDEDHKMRVMPSISARLADDELVSKFYNRVCDFLGEMNYEHYEISNFAQPGFRSRHNSNYWNAECSYLGLGPGAHSYLRAADRRIRFENIKDPNAWNAHPIGFENFETLDAEQQRLENLYLKLRTQQPVAESQVDQSFLKECLRNDWARTHDKMVFLTRAGWLIMESLAARLII